MYKIAFVGYAPYRLPYSEANLHKQMKSNGLKQNCHRVNVIKRTKTKILHNYLVDVLNTVDGFGKNYFRLQIGRGDSIITVIAMMHIFHVGGDGKCLDGLRGCYYSRASFCIICLERRRGMFTKPTKLAKTRVDDQMEKLSFDFQELQKKIVGNHIRGGRFEKRKIYVKTGGADIAIEVAAIKFSSDAGDNRFYEWSLGN